MSRKHNKFTGLGAGGPEFIARDTKEPLVVLGGYRIGKDGSIIRDQLPSDIPDKPTAKQSDLDLLAQHGPQGLESRGLFGVIDRLRTSGVIQ